MKFIIITILYLIAAAFASSYGDIEVECPICKTKYFDEITASGYAFGKRLDLKPIGYIDTPWLIPQCTNCGFVYWKDRFRRKEIRSLTPYVNSTEYRNMVADSQSTYYLLAHLFEHQQYSSNKVGMTFLEASWEVENDNAKRYQLYLRKALKAFKNACKTSEIPMNTEQYLIGELYRLLGHFDSAQVHFDSLLLLDDFKKSPLQELAEYELELIASEESSPQIMYSE